MLYEVISNGYVFGTAKTYEEARQICSKLQKQYPDNNFTIKAVFDMEV